MKLEDQVCSLEIAQKLKKLGVKQGSCFVWKDFGKWELEYNQSCNESQMMIIDCSAFTVAELGELLPDCVHWEQGVYFRTDCRCNASSKIMIAYFDTNNTQLRCMMDTDLLFEENEAEARAKMLIYLLENKLL